jgi:hypothetical protein
MPVPGNPAYKPGKVDAFADVDISEADMPNPMRSARSMYIPFDSSKLEEMDKGPQSEIYRPALDKYLAAKRAAIVKKKGDTELANRPFKVEIILETVEGCSCKWNPATREWVGDCEICGPGKKNSATYIYDRGLSQTTSMIKAGVRVMIPSRKGKGQIAFAETTNTSDRYISREWITIERGNLELRYYDGFDTQIRSSMVDLAGAEGSAARGLCNLRIELTDWCQRSYKGEVVDLTV